MQKTVLLLAVVMAANVDATCHMSTTSSSCHSCAWHAAMNHCMATVAPPSGTMDHCLSKKQADCLKCEWSSAGVCAVAAAAGGHVHGTPAPAAGPMNHGGHQMAPMNHGTGLHAMAFYQSVDSTILFKTWVTDSTGEYVGACFGIFFFGVVTALLQGFVESGAPDLLPLRIATVFVSKTLNYAIMLVTMTMSVMLFITAILGLTVGWSFWEIRKRRERAIAQEEREPAAAADAAMEVSKA